MNSKDTRATSDRWGAQEEVRHDLSILESRSRLLVVDGCDGPEALHEGRVLRGAHRRDRQTARCRDLYGEVPDTCNHVEGLPFPKQTK